MKGLFFTQHRHYTPLILLFSAILPLSAAYISQYGFDLYPCVLCIYQRIPYAIVIFLSIIGLLFAKKFDLLKPLLILCFVAFFVDSAIAFFHMGVEYKWWTGTDKCASTLADSLSALKAAILGAPKVRCDEPQFEFILTMAGWNALYALDAAIYCLILLKRGK